MIFAILPYSSSSAQQKGFFFLCAKRQMGGGGHDDVIHRGGTKRGRDRRGRTSGKYCSVRKYLEQHLRVSYLKVPFGMGGDSATRLRGRAKSAQALSLSLRQTAPRGQVEKHAPQRNSTTHARPDDVCPVMRLLFNFIALFPSGNFVFYEILCSSNFFGPTYLRKYSRGDWIKISYFSKLVDKCHSRFTDDCSINGGGIKTFQALRERKKKKKNELEVSKSNLASIYCFCANLIFISY